MDDFPWSWHSHLMHSRAAPRHFLIVFALAHMLAAHGMLTALGIGISARAGSFGAPALFCINGQDGNSSEPDNRSGQPQPVHHDCAMACAALAGPAPAPADGGGLIVPPIGIGAVIAAAGDEARPILFSGVMQARGPPQTA
jgi:hypothetical protein